MFKKRSHRHTYETMYLKKSAFISSLIITLLMVGMVAPASASLTDWINNVRAGITGRAVSQSVSINVSVGNTAPQVTAVTVIAAQDATENYFTNVTLNFTAYDPDGFSNLNDNGARVNFSKSGETTRINNSCTK